MCLRAAARVRSGTPLQHRPGSQNPNVRAAGCLARIKRSASSTPGCPTAVHALPSPVPVATVAEGLELPVQLTYLSILLAILSGAAFIVVRQVLSRRDMDERSKELGEMIRTGEATSGDYYELGVILARKRLYTQALKNYSKAVKLWDGEDAQIAKVHNAMGYCYLKMSRLSDALEEFKLATSKQPTYVIAWNNLADAYEESNQNKDALAAYEKAYDLDPENSTAKEAVDRLRRRLQRLTIS